MKIIDNTLKYLGFLTAVSVVVLVLLVLYDATARYLFSSGSIALQELEWHIFDVIILLGIAYTLREKSHVRVDIFYASYSPKTKALVNIISSLFFILPFSLLIIYVGIGFVEMSFVQNEASSNPGGLEHRYLVKSLISIAFIFLALQALRDAYLSFKEWRVL